MKASENSAKIGLCGLIGYPLGYTVSPIMHNAAFESLGIGYLYLPFKVREEGLKRAIEGVRVLNIRGLNVTMPHKVAIIPLLDELDPLAEKIGAVNTIVNSGGILKGYNTDAEGFLKALLERSIEPEGKSIVVLGAGGASHAVSLILAQRGANLCILNRLQGLKRAKGLAGRISKISPRKARALELNRENLNGVLAEADILVNTTSVGMSPSIDETLVPAELLRPGLIVYDIVYNPVRTKLLSEAEAAGAKTIPGLEMLLRQGALAFKLWTGREAPIEVMQQAAIKWLEEYEKK